VALYCGHLYGWKGAQTFADAAMRFTNYQLAVFVGGTDWDLEDFKEKNKNNSHILVLGRKPHTEIPLYLKAADVLVLPNSAQYKLSSHYTSPLKLFEYMASGTPIVASDIPSLREVLNERTAVFFEADNPVSLHEAVKSVFERGFETESLNEVKHYTWEKRAQKIANFISQ
jgi:glycosyltransferase involved in cell wall biosynthesis